MLFLVMYDCFLLFETASIYFFQCVCDWVDRDEKFAEVEGIIKRQIKVLSHFAQFFFKILHYFAFNVDFYCVLSCAMF